MLRVPKEHDPADAHRDRDRRVDSNTLADLKLVRSSESFLTDQGPQSITNTILGIPYYLYYRIMGPNPYSNQYCQGPYTKRFDINSSLVWLQAKTT